MSKTKNKGKELVLPALRGIMGDWVYYSCLMDLGQVAARIDYAEEIHKNDQLSDMIQRRLKRGRSSEIAEYLKTQPERFFNSLVVATYGGQPNWYPLSSVQSKSKSGTFAELPEETIGSIGFLALSGDETLFALDGQHRLAGIKKVVASGFDQDPYDEVAVIFVAHKKTQKGLERTRRLFTTLNKTAKPVKKGDIIALDEDDVMAICVRRLIEETNLFAADRIAFVASNNMPVNNTKALTTIGNLYDLLMILFTKSQFEHRRDRPALQRVRPSDEALLEYFEYAKKYFTLMRKAFPQLDSYFSAQNVGTVVKKYRGSHGGDALFRPLGLTIFMEIVATLTKEMTLGQAVRLAARLPTDLDSEPYLGLMWDDTTERITNAHKVTLRETLLYMIGKSAWSESKILERYRKETGDDTAILPSTVL